MICVHWRTLALIGTVVVVCLAIGYADRIAAWTDRHTPGR